MGFFQNKWKIWHFCLSYEHLIQNQKNGYYYFIYWIAKINFKVILEHNQLSHLLILIVGSPNILKLHFSELREYKNNNIITFISKNVLMI